MKMTLQRIILITFVYNLELHTDLQTRKDDLVEDVNNYVNENMKKLEKDNDDGKEIFREGLSKSFMARRESRIMILEGI